MNFFGRRNQMHLILGDLLLIVLFRRRQEGNALGSGGKVKLYELKFYISTVRGTAGGWRNDSPHRKKLFLNGKAYMKVCSFPWRENAFLTPRAGSPSRKTSSLDMRNIN